MTPSEFKAWFEGFTESMDGPPSLKQWDRIQARVKQITGTPTTYPVFVDRYRPAIPYWTGLGQGVCSLQAVGQNTAALASDPVRLTAAAGREGVSYTTLNAGHCDGVVGSAAFDSHSTMNALGKADAASLAA